MPSLHTPMDLKSLFPLETRDEENGIRLDQFFSRRIPQISRARWVRVIEQGLIQVSGKVVDSPSHRLKHPCRIDISPEGLSDLGMLASETEKFYEPVFEGIEPQVVFEDDWICVVNKPAGLAIHPGAGMPWSQTLVAWAYKNGKIGDNRSKDFLQWGDQVIEEGRPGIVHRLDMPTSGLLVMAKSPRAHLKLAKQFQDHTAHRVYYALVPGAQAQNFLNLKSALPPRLESFLKIDPCPIAIKRSPTGVTSFVCFLERDPVQRTRFRVAKSSENSKKAIMHFYLESADQKGEFAWAEVKLETGRTHQIRVQLSFLNMAVCGDSVYGGQEFLRLMLHAHSLKFTHPQTGEPMFFEAEFPSQDIPVGLVPPQPKILSLLSEVQ